MPTLRFGPVQIGSRGSGPAPNPELDFGSGLALMLNFGPDPGPVHQGSGLNQSSEPNCGIPISEALRLAISLCLLLASINVLALSSLTASVSIKQVLYKGRPTAEILKLLRLRIG